MLEVNTQKTQKIGELKNERKIRTSNVIDALITKFDVITMTVNEAAGLRREILLTIASSVASSLGLDPAGFTASLLIKTPGDERETLTVIARSTESRKVGVRYPKQGMLAWDAIERRQVHVTGDVTKEFEGFASRPYKSVISLPVVVGGQGIAAVNVDHAYPFLFDERGLLFQTNLRPYLRLIALSLTKIRSQAEAGV